MRRFLTLLSLMYLLPLSASFAVTVSNIVEQINSTNYGAFHLNLYTSDGDSRGFTDGSSPRTPLATHDLARDFIASNFTAMGYTTWLEPFTFNYTRSGTTYNYTGCNNVVAVKYGTSGDIYLIGAHYDSVDAGQTSSVTLCPGADDNASGVSGLLETARAIKDYTFKDTIIFVAFDGEEKGYHGAIHFLIKNTTVFPAATNSTTFLRSSIKGMISVDMIAFNDPTTPQRVIIGSYDSNITQPIDLALEQAANNYSTVIPFRDNGWTSSDHQIFHNEGIDSVLLIEGDIYDFETLTNSSLPLVETNPHFHTDEDSVDTPNYISYTYASEMTKIIAAYLCDQARVIPPATLNWTREPGDILNLSWWNTPDIAYALYGTPGLPPEGSWSLMQTMPTYSTNHEYKVMIDLNSSTQRMFKVISE